MTIQEMHQFFKLELDKTSALELPAFEPEEIDYWLNMAIRRFVKSRFTGSSNGFGFEQNIKRIEDLKTLITEAIYTADNIATTTDDHDIRVNSYVVDLLDVEYNKWFLLQDEAEISYTSLTGVSETKLQGVTQCTLDTYRSHLDDPYSEHRLHYEEAKPLRLLINNTVELVTDGNYTISGYRLRYLRVPAEVSLTSTIDCDLPEHTHDELVKLAANMALENIESARYQTHQYELNKVE